MRILATRSSRLNSTVKRSRTVSCDAPEASVNARIARSDLAASPSPWRPAFIAISRSSRGRWEFSTLTELSPQLFQPIEEPLPSRFNRMAAHDEPPLTHVVPAPCRSRATLEDQCAPFSRMLPNLRLSAGVLTPIYGSGPRKVHEVFAADVKWPQPGVFRLVRPHPQGRSARSPPRRPYPCGQLLN